MVRRLKGPIAGLKEKRAVLPQALEQTKEPTLPELLIVTHSNEDFYVMNGNRVLIKCEKFERYLDQATAV